MIYYPLTTLMLAGIREILVISTAQDLPSIKSLLGDGENLGVKLSYDVQAEPNGIAEALLIGENFLERKPCALVLGDNLHIMDRAQEILSEAAQLQEGALLFTHQVPDPSRFGVVTFGQNGEVLDITEKPEKPPSDWAVTGLYFYDGSASERAKSLLPSKRGELEITDLNRSYLSGVGDALSIQKMSRSAVWIDMGTPESLHEAASHIQRAQRQSGTKIGCVEEVALRQGFISAEQLRSHATALDKSEYSDYLIRLCAGAPR
jgi:glucose-1-phosphate thymidylyltransferase